MSTLHITSVKSQNHGFLNQFAMEIPTNIDLNKICRVCLLESEQMHSIYSELSENQPRISEILSNISSMKIQTDDGLPAKICSKCADEANICFKFQERCNQSQIVLEEYVKQFPEEKTNFCKNELDNIFLVEERIEENASQSDEDCEIDPLNITLNVIDEANTSTQNNTKINPFQTYSCSACDKSYKYANSLRVHMRNHTDERPYICKRCGKSFKQGSSLIYHERSHTGEQPYRCHLCGKKYKQSGTLTAHMRVHTGQKPFLCSICGRGFRQAPDLGYHMRSHTKEKPYMCNICGKTMSMQSHLVQHMRTHTGERPYKCDECEKAFPSSTRLKRHAIIHTNLKPYSCDVCSKSFNRKSSLKVHAKIHTDERAHVCTICNKGFIQAHALKAHIISHSAELVYLV